jgi:prophage antirepressor-like protein
MTDNAVIPFRFDGSPIRTLKIDGEPRFVLTDVCGVLEIENSRDVAGRLDDDEKAEVGITDTSSNGVTQRRSMTVINESGLYSLILTSRKPSAKRFKKWVTSDVLPTLRKTGRYAMPGAEPSPAATLDLDTVERWLTAVDKVQALAGPAAARSFLERSPLLVVPPSRAGENSPSPTRSSVTSAVIDRFLTDCTESSPGSRVSAAALWGAYLLWRTAVGADAGPTTVNGFGRALRSRLRFIKSDGRNHYLDRRLVAGHGTQIEASRAGGL